MIEKWLFRAGVFYGRFLLPGLFIFLMLSCGGEYKQNKYLGRIPSIEKKYHAMIMELIEGVEQTGDLAATLPLIERFDQIEMSWDQAINQEVRINRFDKPIPVEAPEGLPIEVHDALVEQVIRGNLVLKFRVTTLEAVAANSGLMLVFEALDHKGRVLPNTLSIANNFDQTDKAAGTPWELFGYWETPSIIELEDLDRIRVIRIDG